PCRSASLFLCGGTQSIQNRVYDFARTFMTMNPILWSQHATWLNPHVPVVCPLPANRQASPEYIFSLWFVVVRSYSLWFGVGSLGGMNWSLPRKNRVYECRAAKYTAMIMAPQFNPATKDNVRHLLPHIVSLCLRG